MAASGGDWEGAGGTMENGKSLPIMNALLQNCLGAAPVTIDHTEALARAMAAKTRLLRDAMVGVLAEDRGRGPLQGLWQNLDLS